MRMDGNDKSEAETETRVRGGCVMSLLNYSYTMDNDDNDDDQDDDDDDQDEQDDYSYTIHNNRVPHNAKSQRYIIHLLARCSPS